MKNSITCPSCHTEINIEDVLARKIEAEFQQKLNEEKVKLNSLANELKKREETLDELIQSKLKTERETISVKLKRQLSLENETELNTLKKELQEKSHTVLQLKSREGELLKQKRELEETKAAVDSEIEKRLIEERENLSIKLKKQLSEETEMEINTLKKEIQEKSATMSQLKLKEGELLREKRELEEARASIGLEVEKRISQERNVLETQIKERMKISSDQKIREKDILIGQLNDQVNNMKQKMEQGSMQLQGEAQELIIAETLTQLHPFDQITEIKTGANGADVSQLVRNNFGQECGKVLFESKNTKAFSEAWIPKLKEDMLREKAEIGVIVTRVLPSGITNFDAIEKNIYVCSLEHYKALSVVLRNALLITGEAKQVQLNQGEKTAMLYNYLMGSEFKQQLRVVHDTFVDMHKQLQKDKKQAILGFNKREKQIDKIMLNLTGIAGNINGISGQNVAEWDDFEIEESKTLLS